MVVVDLIGMGKSDKPDIAYSYQEHASYFRGFIKELGLKNITLVIGGVPEGNYKAQLAYLEKLKRSEHPELLIHAAPGVLIPSEMVTWCKGNLKNLKTVFVGKGRHFIQEDQPGKIGKAISEWYGGL